MMSSRPFRAIRMPLSPAPFSGAPAKHGHRRCVPHRAEVLDLQSQAFAVELAMP